MSTTIIVLISIVAIFCFYGVILSKFYRRKKRLEKIHTSLNQNKEKRKSKDNFFRKYLRYYSSKENIGDVQMREIESRPDKDVAFHPTQQPARRKKSSVSRQLSFHVSYLRSSNYVLITLLVFFMCHAPLFVHQMIGVIKFVLSQSLLFHHTVIIFFRIYLRVYQTNHLTVCSQVLNISMPNDTSYSSLTGNETHYMFHHREAHINIVS